MDIPPISKEIKKQFVDYLKQNQRMTVGIIYVGELQGGYVFRNKLPKWTKNMILGMPRYYYLLNDTLSSITEAKGELYYDCMELDSSVNEDRCFMITKDDED